jgi:hypothetical protein
MVELAVTAIEGCDHAGISLTVGGETSTSAQRDDAPGRIDRIQLDLEHGSYRDALRDDELFVSGDLSRGRAAPWPLPRARPRPERVGAAAGRVISAVC